MTTNINADNGVVSGVAGLKTSADNSGVLALQTNGTTSVTVDTSQNVGVGTTSPATKLHVVGNVRSSNGAGTVFSTLATDGVYATGTDLYLLAPTGYSTIFYANNSEKFRFGTSGQLGIGGANYGTSGQVLTSAGAGSAPTWSTPSAGAMTLLATVTASNSATVSFGSSYITSAYSAYLVMFSGWVPDNDRPQYYLKMSSNNNSSFVTCNWCVTRVDSGSVSVMANSSGTDIPIISTGTFSTSVANGGGSGSVYIYNPSSTSVGKTVEWFIGGYSTNSGGEEIWNGTATYRTAATAINAIQFYNANGNISTGIFKLYGIQ